MMTNTETCPTGQAGTEAQSSFYIFVNDTSMVILPVCLYS